MTRIRVWFGFALFLAAEFALFGAAEGAQKWTWIEVGTIPNAVLAVGFCWRRAEVMTRREQAKEPHDDQA